MCGEADDPSMHDKWREGYAKPVDERIARYREILRLHDEGLTDSAIGERLGLRRQRVHQIRTGREPRPVGKTRRWES